MAGIHRPGDGDYGQNQRPDAQHRQLAGKLVQIRDEDEKKGCLGPVDSVKSHGLAAFPSLLVFETGLEAKGVNQLGLAGDAVPDSVHHVSREFLAGLASTLGPQRAHVSLSPIAQSVSLQSDSGWEAGETENAPRTFVTTIGQQSSLSILCSTAYWSLEANTESSSGQHVRPAIRSQLADSPT